MIYGTATITAIHADECAIEVNTSGTITAGMVFRKDATDTHATTYYGVRKKRNGWYYLSKDEFSFLQVNDMLTYGDGYGIYGGDCHHLEGRQGCITSGSTNHVEGLGCIAYGSSGHAEGVSTTVNGGYCHVEGYETASTASASAAHAEGSNTLVTSFACHAEGKSTEARGQGSHTEGSNTITYSNYQHVQGQYNVRDDNSIYAHIVGNGSNTSRSNAHTLDWQGNAWFSGDVYVGSTSGKNKDEGSKKLATENYVDNKAKDNYSESERVVGTWVDGKPLYETTVVYTSPLASGSNQVPHNISNLEWGFSVSGYLPYIYQNTKTSYGLPSYIDSNQYASISSIDATNINIYIGSGWASNFQNGFVLTIRYTKTTDIVSA